MFSPFKGAIREIRAQKVDGVRYHVHLPEVGVPALELDLRQTLADVYRPKYQKLLDIFAIPLNAILPREEFWGRSTLEVLSLYFLEASRLLHESGSPMLIRISSKPMLLAYNANNPVIDKNERIGSLNLLRGEYTTNAQIVFNFAPYSVGSLEPTFHS